jgi:hypothetical protein
MFGGGAMEASSYWSRSAYAWVVICKNSKAHRAANVNAGHKIPLAETDEYASPPKVRSFGVTCDECGKEYSYEVEEVLRLEMDLPPDFKPHPPFE